MRPEELQIGDWVYSLIDSGGKVVREPQMIRGIWTDSDGDEDVCTIKTDRSDVWYPIETFEPIPITHEILKENGFKKKDVFDGWVHYESFPLIDFVLHEDDEGYYIDLMDARIKYIHQLQQAMRLCRINKEITLN